MNRLILPWLYQKDGQQELQHNLNGKNIKQRSLVIMPAAMWMWCIKAPERVDENHRMLVFDCTTDDPITNAMNGDYSV